MNLANRKVMEMRFFFTLLLVFSLFNINAQTTDIQLRTGVAVKAQIWKDLDGVIEIQQRFNKNISSTDLFLVEAGLAYKINKNWRFSVGYRYALEQNYKQNYLDKQRANASLRYKNEFKGFSYKIRSGFQYNFDDLSVFSEFYTQKLYNRNSFELGYNIFGSRFSPYINYEFFYHINNRNTNIINKKRLGAGCNIHINNSSEIDLHYFLEKEINRVNPENAHVLELMYSYSF